MKEQIQAIAEAVAASEGTLDVKSTITMMLDVMALQASKIEDLEKGQQRMREAFSTISSGGKIPTQMGGSNGGFSIG
jgi:hypothetical protein